MWLCSFFFLVKSTQNQKLDLLDLTLFAAAIIIPPCPFIVYISAFYYSFDPYFYVFGDLLGDHEYKYCSALTYFTFLIFRLFFTLAAFELSRTTSFATMNVVIVLKALNNVLRVIFIRRTTCPMNFVHRMNRYKKLCIINKYLMYALKEAISVTITGGFWGIVMVSWVVIKCYFKMPFSMYFMIFVMLVGLVFAYVVILTIFCKFSHNISMSKKLLQKEANAIYLNSRSVSKRWYALMLKKKANSAVPMYLYYHPFLRIDRRFCRDLSGNLLCRIFDAILIFTGKRIE